MANENYLEQEIERLRGKLNEVQSEINVLKRDENVGKYIMLNDKYNSIMEYINTLTIGLENKRQKACKHVWITDLSGTLCCVKCHLSRNTDNERLSNNISEGTFTNVVCDRKTAYDMYDNIVKQNDRISDEEATALLVNACKNMPNIYGYSRQRHL